MTGLRHGYIRTASHLPSEAEQLGILEAHGVTRERVETEHSRVRRRKLACETERSLVGLHAVLSRCRTDDLVVVSVPAILAATEASVRQALVAAQEARATVLACDTGQPVRLFADVEAFVARARKGWAAGRAAHARQFGGARPGRRKKRMKVSDQQARAWWHDRTLTKEWIEERTGVSKRTLWTRFGNRGG